MRRVLLVSALFLAAGCASLEVRHSDPIPMKVAKVLFRIPLGVATVGISEMEIDEAIYNRDAALYGWEPRRGIDPAAAALILQGNRTSPPVFQSEPIKKPTVCDIRPMGNAAQAVCY